MRSQICHVCNSPDTIKYYEKKEWNYNGKKYQLRQCQNCLSAFTTPLPDDHSIELVYKELFNYQWYKDHYDAKYKDCQTRIHEYARYLTNRRILDFGGGLGYFSSAAHDNGYDSKTYDPYCNENNSLIKEKFDIIVALHALEHSNKLNAFMDSIKNLLTTDGILIIAVPNFLSDGYKKLGMEWVWAQPPLVHIFHFTYIGLKTLLERHGFNILEHSYHDRWDANLEADLNQATRFRALDQAWSRKLFNRIPIYRKYISKRNSDLRFKALEQSLIKNRKNSEVLSELQIIAQRS